MDMTVDKRSWQIKPDLIKMFRDKSIPGTLEAVTARKTVGGTCDGSSATLRVTSTEFDNLVYWLNHNVTIQIAVTCDGQLVTAYHFTPLQAAFAVIQAGIAEINGRLKRIERQLEGHGHELCEDSPIPDETKQLSPGMSGMAAFEPDAG